MTWLRENVHEPRMRRIVFSIGDAFGFVSAASTILHHTWLGTEGNEDGGGTLGALAMSTGAVLDSS
jgi:hypothetical protein